MDGIEKDVSDRFGVMLVTHADPVDIHDERIAGLRELLKEVIRDEHQEGLSFHDLRIINAANGGLNVVFDLLVPWNLSKNEISQLKKRIREELKKKAPGLTPVITVEHGY